MALHLTSLDAVRHVNRQSDQATAQIWSGLASQHQRAPWRHCHSCWAFPSSGTSTTLHRPRTGGDITVRFGPARAGPGLAGQARVLVGQGPSGPLGPAGMSWATLGRAGPAAACAQWPGRTRPDQPDLAWRPESLAVPEVRIVYASRVRRPNLGPRGRGRKRGRAKDRAKRTALLGRGLRNGRQTRRIWKAILFVWQNFLINIIMSCSCQMEPHVISEKMEFQMFSE